MARTTKPRVYTGYTWNIELPKSLLMLSQGARTLNLGQTKSSAYNDCETKGSISMHIPCFGGVKMPEDVCQHARTWKQGERKSLKLCRKRCPLACLSNNMLDLRMHHSQFMGGDQDRLKWWILFGRTGQNPGNGFSLALNLHLLVSRGAARNLYCETETVGDHPPFAKPRHRRHHYFSTTRSPEQTINCAAPRRWAALSPFSRPPYSKHLQAFSPTSSLPLAQVLTQTHWHSESLNPSAGPLATTPKASIKTSIHRELKQPRNWSFFKWNHFFLPPIPSVSLPNWWSKIKPLRIAPLLPTVNTMKAGSLEWTTSALKDWDRGKEDLIISKKCSDTFGCMDWILRRYGSESVKVIWMGC